MPKYVIERDMPNIGSKSPEEFQEVAKKSLQVIDSLNQPIFWLESFITDNKVYALYIAPNVDVLHEHARQCGLPINNVSEVRAVVDPSFADRVPREQFRPTKTR